MSQIKEVSFSTEKNDGVSYKAPVSGLFDSLLENRVREEEGFSLQTLASMSFQKIWKTTVGDESAFKARVSLPGNKVGEIFRFGHSEHFRSCVSLGIDSCH